MPRAKRARARNKISESVAKFQKDVEITQKSLETRFDAVCGNGDLPSDDSEQLFRTMLAKALGPDYTFISKRKRAAQVASVSSDDEPEIPRAPVEQTERRKKAVSIIDIPATPVEERLSHDSSHKDKENRFVVSKDGKLSESAINQFKKPGVDGKLDEGGGNSVRLFKPVYRPKSKRAQSHESSDRPLKRAHPRKEPETRLAEKTPGLSKLGFGNMIPQAIHDQPAVEKRPIAIENEDVDDDVIEDEVEDKDVVDTEEKEVAEDEVVPDREEEDGRGEIATEAADLKEQTEIIPAKSPKQDKPLDCGEEVSNKDEIVNSEEEAEKQNETVDAEMEVGICDVIVDAEIEVKNRDKVDENQVQPLAGEVEQESEQKKKHSIEPLFPPSIFAVPSPTPKKKTISFAPGTKKRSSDSVEANASKRIRQGTLAGKSDLRKRIDSMRERMSQKSTETPGISKGGVSQRTNTTSSGFFSANSRKCSQSGEDEEMDDIEQAETGARGLFDQFEKSPSVDTPARALEERFNESSPDNRRGSSEMQKDADDGDSVMNDANESNCQVSGAAPGVLSNLMTSVKSFLPNTMAIPGFQPPQNEESEEEKAKRLEKERKEDEERREAETLARREAAKQVRLAEAREKQRRVEEKRRALELEIQKKEEEKKQKELARKQRQKREIEERKRKKAEEDRKRELRFQKVREHQEKVAAEEAAKRADLERKLAAARMAQAAKLNPKAKIGGSSRAPMSERKPPLSAMKGQATPGAQRQLFRKKSTEVSSYEMSADKDRGNYSDDSSSESEEAKARRKGKKIPEWATKNNVAKAVNEQRTDPDKHFTRIQGVNLEDVFASTNQQKMRYRSRNSSGQWAKDRLTAKEEMEYKKKSGYI